MTEQPAHTMARYSKKDFIPKKEALSEAKEFFQIAINKATSGAHSVLGGKTILLFDYLSAFENSDERIQKVTRFLELGRIGSQKDFFLEDQMRKTEEMMTMKWIRSRWRILISATEAWWDQQTTSPTTIIEDALMQAVTSDLNY